MVFTPGTPVLPTGSLVPLLGGGTNTKCCLPVLGDWEYIAEWTKSDIKNTFCGLMDGCE